MAEAAFLLILCYIADLIFGDPEGFIHPVRATGKLIAFLDKRLNGASRFRAERTKGTIAAIIVLGISVSLAYLFIRLAREFNPLLGSLAWVYLGYTSLSIKDMRVKTKATLEELEKDSIPQARRELSKIVGRDTHDLDKDKIAKATVESIAEGTNDGVIAPLFYLILGGPVLAIAYKSINTLDSMLGYRNERYIHFGWFSARLDDIANFIPARISGFLIALSSKNFKQSFRMMLRDGRKHPSPNSGLSISAMAGALGTKLGGPCSYQGKLCQKDYFGEEKRVIQPAFIKEALTISLLASFLMLSIGVVLRWII